MWFFFSFIRTKQTQTERVRSKKDDCKARKMIVTQVQLGGQQPKLLAMTIDCMLSLPPHVPHSTLNSKNAIAKGLVCFPQSLYKIIVNPLSKKKVKHQSFW